MRTPPKVSDPLSIFGDRAKDIDARATNPIVRWSDWALRLGLAGYDRNTRRRLLIVNLSGYLSALSSLSFAISFALQNFSVFIWLIIGNVLSAILTATAPYWHRYNSVASASVMTTTVAITLFFFVSELGRDSGIQLNYIGAVAIAFVIFGLDHLRIVALVTVVCIVGNIACNFLFETGRVQWAVEPGFMAQIYVLSASTIMIILAAIVWYAFRVAADAEARAKRLLDNVLPLTISDRLMQAPDDPIADRFDEATVLFGDLVGFTTMSERLPAGEMVRMLNELFSRFDAIGAELNIEKIKTIGDAYMAVSGVPDLRDDHAERMMKLAIGMHEAADEVSKMFDQQLNLRIGMASGPITAGVIGKTKFAYDVWSPTVNLAARLESDSQSGAIHISDKTYRYLKDDYSFEMAPKSNLKGIGRVQSWLWVRPKQ